MKITNLQREVAKVASKSTVRVELACVHHTGKVAVATDAFRLVEMTASKAEASAPILVNAKSLLKAKIKTNADIDNRGITADGVQYPLVTSKNVKDYPEYKKLFMAKAKGYVEVKVNGEYLAEIAEILSKLDTFKAITLRIDKDNKYAAIGFSAEGKDHTARALLMPMNQ